MIELSTDAGQRRSIGAVLFDMDGTIIDSTEATARLWNGWAAEHGVTEDFVILHGQPAVDTIRRSFPNADDQAIDTLAISQARDECTDLDGVAPMPGAVALIGWLEAHGVPWAVVTGSGTLLAEARLGAAALRPAVLVSCDDTERGKPGPDPYLLGADLIGVPINECLVVEDSPAGVASGLSSGGVTAALNGVTSGRTGQAADICITDLAHLHELLKAGLTD